LIVAHSPKGSVLRLLDAKIVKGIALPRHSLKRPIQYGNSIKARTVYMSQFPSCRWVEFENTLMTKSVCLSALGLFATLTCKPTMGWRDSTAGQSSNQLPEKGLTASKALSYLFDGKDPERMR
jgi:hypothetical protein